jgi:signal transduction histidine kinase
MLDPELLIRISLELRQPLQRVIGFCDLMHRGKIEPGSDEQHRCLSDVLASARRSIQLLDDVLELARLQTRSAELQQGRIDVALVVAEMTELLATSARRKGVELAMEPPAELPSVQGDVCRLRQVLSGYLSEAIDRTPPGGRITARVLADADGFYRLEVEDAAESLSAAAVEELFTLARPHRGVGPRGLGLALTKHIVEAQGGEVGGRARSGGGNLFFAVLPTRGGRDARPGTN